MDIWSTICLLAQEQAPKAAQPNPIWGMLIIFLPVIVVWYLMFGLPQSRERAKHDDMLKSLKKNDPVVTIGGILGTVVNVSEDGEEVTVKVDDNARLKLRRNAIREVVQKDKPESS